MLRGKKSSQVCNFSLLFSVFTEKNRSYVISSFVETKGEAMIAKTSVEFVEYPSRVLRREKTTAATNNTKTESLCSSGAEFDPK